MANIKIKVCGITDPGNVLEVCRYRPDCIGFIFYNRSLRYVGDFPDPNLFFSVPEGIERVAVFVNEHYEQMLNLTTKYRIDTVQLHGMESPGICRTLRMHGKNVIKAFPGTEVQNTRILRDYSEVVDYFLFDTPIRSFGGSGRKFDWSVLSKLKTEVRFFLSGGIAPGDAELLRAIDVPMFYAADINSRFETAPGLKDSKLVGNFIKAVKDEK